MKEAEAGKARSWLVVGGLVSYCLAVTALTGDVGFEGDDWWIFSWPYWRSYPDALWTFARDCLRPVEGLYWISLFELFGFNKVVFHLCSLLLLAGACILMGLCLARAFPQRRGFAILAPLFAFFLPTTSCLTYVLATDNSRLSLLLFWASALAFLRWTERAASWRGLIGPVLLYILAFLTYEAPSFLLFVVPLLVWPLRIRYREHLTERAYWTRLAAGIGAAFALAVGIRFLLLSGGAVGHRNILPPWELIVSQIGLLPFYLLAPFTYASNNPWPWLFGTGVAVWAAALLFGASQSPDNRDPAATFVGSRYYLVLLGVAVLLLGLVPYQLAGYGSVPPKLSETVLIKWGLAPEGQTWWFNFNWSSRIYSAGTFGLAIMLAAGLSDWAHRRLRALGAVVAVTALAFMAVFHAGLSDDWKEASCVRNGVIASLLSQVPDVKPGTNFLFLDLNCCQGRAVVFRGWNGLRELTRILYDDPTLGAWYVYPYAWKWPNELFHQATVSEDGFVSRGVKHDRPIPSDSLILFRRTSCTLASLDRIDSDDGLVPTGIRWQGADCLQSNPDRIVGWSSSVRSAGTPKKNMLTTGLIGTFHLSEIKLARRIPLLWKYRLLTKAAKNRLLIGYRSLK